MLAKGFGIPGFTVERTEEFGEALQRMLAVQGPALMHLKLDARDVSPFSGSER
jgi:thiamine pyrophosphate-dependent acetolactate synthase large subunit-like protein